MRDLPLAFVIEDDKNLSVAFSEAMLAASYQVITIMNGIEALAKLKELTPTIIILDLHIPGINGVDLLRYIRQNERFAGVKVIITTADNRKAEELQDQADLVLIKPVGFLQLRDMALRLNPMRAST